MASVADVNRTYHGTSGLKKRRNCLVNSHRNTLDYDSIANAHFQHRSIDASRRRILQLIMYDEVRVTKRDIGIPGNGNNTG